MGHSINSITFRAGKSLLWRTLLISPVNLKYFFFNFSKSFLIFFRYSNYLFKLKYFKILYKKGFFFSHIILRRTTVGQYSLKIFLYDPMFRQLSRRLNFFLLNIRNRLKRRGRRNNRRNVNRLSFRQKSVQMFNIGLRRKLLPNKLKEFKRIRTLLSAGTLYYNNYSRKFFELIHKNFFYLWPLKSYIGLRKNLFLRGIRNFNNNKPRIPLKNKFFLNSNFSKLLLSNVGAKYLKKKFDIRHKFLRWLILSKNRIKFLSRNFVNRTSKSFSAVLPKSVIVVHSRKKNKILLDNLNLKFFRFKQNLNKVANIKRYSKDLLGLYNYDRLKVFNHKYLMCLFLNKKRNYNEFLKFFDKKKKIRKTKNFVINFGTTFLKTKKKKLFFMNKKNKRKRFTRLSLFLKVFIFKLKKIVKYFFYSNKDLSLMNRLSFFYKFFLIILRHVKFKNKRLLKKIYRKKKNFFYKKNRKFYRSINQSFFFRLFFTFIFFIKKIFDLQRRLIFLRKYHTLTSKNLIGKLSRIINGIFFLFLKELILLKIKKHLKKIKFEFYKYLTSNLSYFFFYKFSRLLNLPVNSKNLLQVNIRPISVFMGLTPDVYVNYLRLKIRRRFNFKSLMWPFLKKLKFIKYIKGVYGLGNGRFTRRQRSSTFKVSKGKVRFSTISTYLSYAFLPIITRYGTCGVHIFFNYKKNVISFKYRFDSTFKFY